MIFKEMIPKKPFSTIKNDLPAGIVVFLVALPLCLGIALASGAPLISGIITGVIGGIITAMFSNSHLSVSGPAAGLTVIVLMGIEKFQSFEIFLAAVVLAGLLQFIMGYARAGVIGHYFPTSVIRGMLSAIGIILILKQFPYFIGFNVDTFGDMEIVSTQDGGNTFSHLVDAVTHINLGSLIIGVFTLFMILFWDNYLKNKVEVLKFMPGALIAIVLAVILEIFIIASFPNFALSSEYYVNIFVVSSFSDIKGLLAFPNFSMLANIDFWLLVVQVALIASLETLLSIDAIDKLDPQKRKTDLNRELKAQGIGNMLSGSIGGIPMTAVIVRSTANLESGGKTKMAAIYHGWLLLLCVLLIPGVLNMIPLSSLAAILIIVGFKLAKPSLFIRQWKIGHQQFIPFIITILAILFTDLLIGILIGLGVGIVYVLYFNYKVTYFITKSVDSEDGRDTVVLELSEHVSFLNKANLQAVLKYVPDKCRLIVDGHKNIDIDYDALVILKNFEVSAKERGIDYQIKNVNFPVHI